MKIFLNKKKLIKILNNKKKLGFVPTMGNIHLGHISLINRSIAQCDKTIVTIFINKPQFNRGGDFNKYPRTLNKDISILKKLKVDYLYLPSHKQIYPKGNNKKIKISSFEKKLCGKFRPGHFKAVVDVIDRFIKIINPNNMYFGKKDMQQLIIVKDYISKNFNKIKVIACDTIREKNGIAYSSRNALLSQKELLIASKVYKILVKNKKNLFKKKISIKKINDQILNLGIRKIDYIKFLDINKIIKPYKIKSKYRIFIAYYLHSTRLIDNI